MRRSWSHPDSQASAGRINHGHKGEVLETFPQRNPRDSGYEQNYKQESPQTGAEFISESKGHKIIGGGHDDEKIELTVLKDVPADDPLVKE